MYKNKFFEKIDYKSSVYETLICNMKKDKRRKRWKKERAKYGGWDSRCSWALNTLIIETLYTWLSIYMKYAPRVIDLDYHVFTITDPKTNETKDKTQRECILMILANLKTILKSENNAADRHTQKDVKIATRRAFHILAEIMPSLWW